VRVDNKWDGVAGLNARRRFVHRHHLLQRQPAPNGIQQRVAALVSGWYISGGGGWGRGGGAGPPPPPPPAAGGPRAGRPAAAGGPAAGRPAGAAGGGTATAAAGAGAGVGAGADTGGRATGAAAAGPAVMGVGAGAVAAGDLAAVGAVRLAPPAAASEYVTPALPAPGAPSPLTAAAVRLAYMRAVMLLRDDVWGNAAGAPDGADDGGAPAVPAAGLVAEEGAAPAPPAAAGAVTPPPNMLLASRVSHSMNARKSLLPRWESKSVTPCTVSSLRKYSFNPALRSCRNAGSGLENRAHGAGGSSHTDTLAPY